MSRKRQRPGILMGLVSPPDLNRLLSFVAELLTEAIGSAVIWAGSAIVDVLVHVGDSLGEQTSSLQGLPEPLTSSLLVTVLATASAVLGLYKVFAFLRE